MANQDFIMHIHLLGYSEATISRILDTLLLRDYSEEVVIVQNIEVKELILFCPPGIKYRKIFWDQWKFDAQDHRCLPAVMSPQVKKTIVDFFNKHHGINEEHYITLSHPSSVIASTAEVGNGSFIEPGVVIASFASFGFGVYVNRGSTIGHHVIIGDFVNIGPGVHIAGHCHVGGGSQIGIGTVVFDQIKIGSNTIIGGGSVVTKDIPDNVIAWGNPCKVVKNISET